MRRRLKKCVFFFLVHRQHMCLSVAAQAHYLPQLNSVWFSVYNVNHCNVSIKSQTFSCSSYLPTNYEITFHASSLFLSTQFPFRTHYHLQLLTCTVCVNPGKAHKPPLFHLHGQKILGFFYGSLTRRPNYQLACPKKHSNQELNQPHQPNRLICLACAAGLVYDKLLIKASLSTAPPVAKVKFHHSKKQKPLSQFF